MDKTVILIKPVQEEPKTQYILIMYRGGPFAGGRPVTIAVDAFEPVLHKDSILYYRGLVDGRQVIAFPYDTNYVLIDRNLVTTITPLEAAQRQKAEDDELDAVLPKETPALFAATDNQGYL